MAEKEPTRFGRYELLEELAVGGMAQLFRARAVGAHGFALPVVIKKILSHLALDASFQAMFVDEARITARLQHPKIVQVLELGSEGGELYIAMEYVDGLDVLTLLRECSRQGESLGTALAVHVAHEVLDALDYAHAAVDEDGQPLGIVHRDISPGNVMVSRRGDVKLTDFGIAHALRRQQKTQAGILKGKYSYMSPEQIETGAVDARSDLFSTATLLAEMLMGRHLFTAPNDLDVLLMVRDVRLDRLDEYGGDIPAGLRAILERALRQRPEERFATAGEFRDALADWLFAEGARVGARDLAQLMRRLHPEAAPPPVPAAAEKIDTLSGPSTRNRQIRAEEAARVGRELFSRSPTEPMAEAPDLDEDDDAIPIVEQPPERLAPQRARRSPERGAPDREGSLGENSPFRLFYEIAMRDGCGLLVAERGPVAKEVYFDRGNPQFARSNLMSERLGEFLVAEGVISRDEQQRALALLPHFGGRLGDTLVGLGLMRPIDAFRYLVRQVRDKLVDLCTWSDGAFRWHEDEKNPWPALALELSSLEILGGAASRLDRRRVESWALEVVSGVPSPEGDRAELVRFGLGELPETVVQFLDGRTCIGELTQQLGEDDRLDVLRVLYLLVQCGWARLD